MDVVHRRCAGLDISKKDAVRVVGGGRGGPRLAHAHRTSPYRDPGPDYYARRNPDKTRDRAIDQLRVIGYDVTLTPRAVTDPLHQ